MTTHSVRRPHRPLTDTQRELAEKNMGLVIFSLQSLRIPRDYWQPLISEGGLALVKSARAFRPELGFKFSTYATHAIQMAVGMAWRRMQAGQLKSLEYEMGGDDGGLSLRTTLGIRDQEWSGTAPDAWMACLNEQERTVIRFRAAGMTLAAIGEALGLSHERVRQLSVRAYQKIAADLKRRNDPNMLDRKIDADRMFRRAELWESKARVVA